jgi:hypothetical protein
VGGTSVKAAKIWYFGLNFYLSILRRVLLILEISIFPLISVVGRNSDFYG